jgi:hypothetical protein
MDKYTVGVNFTPGGKISLLGVKPLWTLLHSPKEESVFIPRFATWVNFNPRGKISILGAK